MGKWDVGCMGNLYDIHKYSKIKRLSKRRKGKRWHMEIKYIPNIFRLADMLSTTEFITPAH